MFREIRRKEKQLTIEECREVLTKAEYGTLATMGTDGYPYAVSVNYVYFNDSIYFHCAQIGHKLDNIEFCPNVSFNVVTDVFVVPLIKNESKTRFSGFDTNFNSVVIFGKAIEVHDSEKNNGLNALLGKFLRLTSSDQHLEEGLKYVQQSANRTALIKIEIERLTGKRGIRKNLKIAGKQH